MTVMRTHSRPRTNAFLEALIIRRKRRYTFRPRVRNASFVEPLSTFRTDVEAAVLNSPTPLHASADAGAAALRECVARSARRYLADLHGTPCSEGLYALLMREVEAPLLSEVLRWCGGNQSRAAEALGINRATLRKKLLAHGLV